MPDTTDHPPAGIAPDVEAELDAALTRLRAENPGLTNDVAAGLLPEHLRQPFWRRVVTRYVESELATMEAIEAKLAEIAESSDWDDALRVEAALGIAAIGKVDPSDDEDVKRALLARIETRANSERAAGEAAKGATP